MRLLLKLNVLLIIAFALVWIVQDRVASDRALKQNQVAVNDEAQLMIQEALAVRKYTEDQIQPLVPLRAREAEFHSQWVPFYAATEVFKNLKQQERFKDFEYREAAINPTNPNDRADGWESNMIRQFQLNHSIQTYVGERADIGHYAVVNAIPISKDCLSCHGSPSAAPPEMLRKYRSSTSGFGWKEGDIAGAQIVYIPNSESDHLIGSHNQSQTMNRLIFFIVMLVIVNLAVIVAVVRPLSRLSKNADELSKENFDVAELNARGIGGRDEVSDLADSFNRLHRSVKIAMRRTARQGP